MWKIVAGILVSLGILGVVTFLFFPQVYLSILVRTVWYKPVMDVVPVEKSMSAKDGRFTDSVSYSALGLDFLVPWNNLEKKRESDSTILFSSETNQIAILSPKESYVEELKKDQSFDIKIMQNIWGQGVLDSDYKLLMRVGNLTTASITPFVSPQVAAGNLTLLTLKPVFFLGSNEGIYHFNNGEVMGFVFYNSNPKSESWIIELFDNQNRHRTILVKGTEEEVDFILSSVKFQQ